MDLEFNVKNQTLKRIDYNKVVNESFHYLNLKFNFLTDDWEDLTKWALFITKDKTYRVAFEEKETDNDVEYFVEVPYVVLNNDRFIFSIYGNDTEQTKRITTNELMIFVNNSGYTDDVDDWIDSDGRFPSNCERINSRSC